MPRLDPPATPPKPPTKPLTDWELDAQGNNWVMPAAPLWKRLPVVRHVRAVVLSVRVARHEQFHRARGAIPSGYDRWVLHGIWIGKERITE